MSSFSKEKPMRFIINVNKCKFSRKTAIINVKNCRFVTTSRHVKGSGYNTQFLLYPRPFTCQKEFLLFYMCQLWALHVFTKRQFFTFIFAVFLLNLFCGCILLHNPYLRCCGAAKTNGSYTGIRLAV